MVGEVTVRPVRGSEYAALGEVTVSAYRTIPGYAPSAEYESVLRDDPSVSCLPSGIDDLLAEWRLLGPDAEELADAVAEAPLTRVRLWQWLRAGLARDAPRLALSPCVAPGRIRQHRRLSDRCDDSGGCVWQ